MPRNRHQISHCILMLVFKKFVFAHLICARFLEHCFYVIHRKTQSGFRLICTNWPQWQSWSQMPDSSGHADGVQKQTWKCWNEFMNQSFYVHELTPPEINMVQILILLVQILHHNFYANFVLSWDCGFFLFWNLLRFGHLKKHVHENLFCLFNLYFKRIFFP